MKKIVPLLGLALIVAVIFGVTFISEFVGGSGDKTKPIGGGGETVTTVGQALVFKEELCRYDPKSDWIQNRMFKGFYEQGEEDTVLFWFTNRSHLPVTVRSIGASCTTCTAANICHVEPELLAEYAKLNAAGALTSLLGPQVPDLMAAFAATQFLKKLPWQAIDLKSPGTALTLPPGGTKEKPGLGLVQLRISPKFSGSPEPIAGFTSVADGPNEVPKEHKLQVSFRVVTGFAAAPSVIDVGEMAEGTQPRTFDVTTWSATRTFGDRFPPPSMRPAGDDPHISIGTPRPLSGDEMTLYNQRIEAETKTPNRVMAAYRYPITVHRNLPGKQPEIGPFNRELFIAGINNDTVRIPVKGTVSGIVRLREGRSVEFGNYEARSDKVMKTALVSDDPNLELSVVTSETTPRFLQVTLDPPVLSGGAREWKLTLRIPANQGFVPNWTGSVVLRSPGSNPLTVRVPVTGNGTRR